MALEDQYEYCYFYSKTTSVTVSMNISAELLLKLSHLIAVPMARAQAYGRIWGPTHTDGMHADTYWTLGVINLHVVKIYAPPFTLTRHDVGLFPQFFELFFQPDRVFFAI